MMNLFKDLFDEPNTNYSNHSNTTILNTADNFKYVNGQVMKINTNNLLDQYFTHPNIALNLYETSRQIIGQYESNMDAFHWIEPSAGNGVFFNLLPKHQRTGIDINPLTHDNNDIIKADYLTFTLPNNTKNIVIGNPPFGHRGVMALDFINHSEQADYVCFILPMFFESQGKGSIKYRVKGFNLIYSAPLEDNSFYIPNTNKHVTVKCVFQIWSKHHKNNELEANDFNWYKNKNNEPFSDLLKLFTVSLAKNRECGKRWIFEETADYYLSSTFYKQNKVVKSFEEVKYKSGIAIVLTTQDPFKREKINTLLNNADWTHYGSLATNACYHIGKSNIFKLIKSNLNLLT